MLTRVAWYLLGVGLAVGIMLIHPSPQIDLFLGTGDRAQSVTWGLAYGLIGAAQAVIYAFLRYHRIRFPEVRSYPGALLNATVTAFIDEVAFRGALFGLLLMPGPTIRRSRTSSRRSSTRSRPASARRAGTVTCSC